MARVKRGTTAHKRRGGLLKHAKGFKWGRKSKYRAAKEGLYHAWSLSYKGRKLKKRDNRRLWQVKISAGVRTDSELSYSRFIHALKKNNILLDRKILSQLAEQNPDIFHHLIDSVKE